ncbi:MAG: hypothetical protein ACK415_07685 [Thermodesulfovibrionales bacterium]
MSDTGRNIKKGLILPWRDEGGRQKALIRLKADGGRRDDDSLHSFSIYTFDAKSGNFIYSEEITSLSDLRRFDRLTMGIAEKKIEEFYLSLPLSMLGFRILNLPFSDKKKITEVIPFELQGLIMENVDDIVFDSLCLGKEDGGFNVLVVYIEKSRFDSVLSVLSKAGIDPVIAGSIEIGYILKETTDPVQITERLIDYADRSDIKFEEKMDFISEELKNPTINLRTGAFEFRGDTERISRAVKIMTFLLIMIAIVINLDLSFRILRDRKDITLIRKEMKRSYSELFPSEKKITDELYQLKAHLKDVKEKRDLIGGVQVTEFLLKLSQMRSGGIVFNEIGVSTEGLSLKGEAASMDEINNLKTVLSGIIQEINASDIKPLVGGRLGFSVSGRIKR